MPPELPYYTQAFRAAVRHMGGLDVAHEATGIAERNLQRMHAGTSRTPPRLLRELAEGTDATGATAIGADLRAAADRLDRENPRHA